MNHERTDDIAQPASSAVMLAIAIEQARYAFTRFERACWDGPVEDVDRARDAVVDVVDLVSRVASYAMNTAPDLADFIAANPHPAPAEPAP